MIIALSQLATISIVSLTLILANILLYMIIRRYKPTAIIYLLTGTFEIGIIKSPLPTVVTVVVKCVCQRLLRVTCPRVRR